MKPRACLLLWRDPSLASVIILSTYFLIALALALVVLMRPYFRSWVVRPRRSALRWSGGLFSLGTRLPCLMQVIRDPLSIAVKQLSKLVDSAKTLEIWWKDYVVFGWCCNWEDHGLLLQCFLQFCWKPTAESSAVDFHRFWDQPKRNKHFVCMKKVFTFKTISTASSFQWTKHRPRKSITTWRQKKKKNGRKGENNTDNNQNEICNNWRWSNQKHMLNVTYIMKWDTESQEEVMP